MNNKTVLITGATSGVGKATAIALAKLGLKIVILARNKQKADKTLLEILNAVPGAELEILEGDLASLKSIKKAAEVFVSKYDKLDILINNAGGVFSKKEITEDGFEWGFQVNHLGHFLLTYLLLDKLKAAGNSRIINLSSEAHRMGSIDFTNLNCERKFSGWRQYGATKLMNLIFAKSIANKFGESGLMAFSVHPGVVRTGFGANNSGLLSFFNKMPFLITPEKGAETSVFLATADATKLVNGGYYKKSAIAYAGVESQDFEVQTELWDVSEKMLKEKNLI